MEERIDDKIFTAATVVYLLFLPLYPITASLMDEVTSNTVIAVATVVNVLVTVVYAFFTWHLWRQTRVAADAARRGADASVESTAVAPRPWWRSSAPTCSRRPSVPMSTGMRRPGRSAGESLLNGKTSDRPRRSP